MNLKALYTVLNFLLFRVESGLSAHCAEVIGSRDKAMEVREVEGRGGKSGEVGVNGSRWVSVKVAGMWGEVSGSDSDVIECLRKSLDMVRGLQMSIGKSSDKSGNQSSDANNNPHISGTKLKSP